MNCSQRVPVWWLLNANERASPCAEKIRDTLALDIENKRVELNAPERVQVIQAAAVPEQLDQTLRMQLSALGLLGTFGLVVAGFVLFEWFAHRVGSSREVTAEAGLRMIGSIPSPDTGGILGTGFLSKSVEADEWQRAVVESTDVVRTFLLDMSIGASGIDSRDQRRLRRGQDHGGQSTGCQPRSHWSSSGSCRR